MLMVNSKIFTAPTGRNKQLRAKPSTSLDIQTDNKNLYMSVTPDSRKPKSALNLHSD